LIVWYINKIDYIAKTNEPNDMKNLLLRLKPEYKERLDVMAEEYPNTHKNLVSTLSGSENLLYCPIWLMLDLKGLQGDKFINDFTVSDLIDMFENSDA